MVSMKKKRNIIHQLSSNIPSYLEPEFFKLSLKSLLSGALNLLCLFTTAKGLDHIAETILSYLDAKSLCSAELVCKEWYRVISEGMLWKKLMERMVRTDNLWKGLADRRGW